MKVYVVKAALISVLFTDGISVFLTTGGLLGGPEGGQHVHSACVLSVRSPLE
jgi:hypothetical protein